MDTSRTELINPSRLSPLSDRSIHRLFRLILSKLQTSLTLTIREPLPTLSCVLPLGVLSKQLSKRFVVNHIQVSSFLLSIFYLLSFFSRDDRILPDQHLLTIALFLHLRIVFVPIV